MGNSCSDPKHGRHPHPEPPYAFRREWTKLPCAYPPPPPHREAILAALQYQMHRALGDTNLGRWAQLMQASIPFWPYTTLSSVRAVRSKVHTNAWFIHVPPPHFVIYVCINLRTGAAHLGQTSQSPIQRLHKHHTDTEAAVDCATFHKLLPTTNMSDWVTIPVQ